MSATSEGREPCGRCGVYRDLHPRKDCAKSRHSYWLDRHSPLVHVANWLWIHALRSRTRWVIAERIHRHTGWCWCDLYDSVHYADQWADFRADYTGDNTCLCDFPRVWTGQPPTGNCYCSTPENIAAEVTDD